MESGRNSEFNSYEMLFPFTSKESLREAILVCNPTKKPKLSQYYFCISSKYYSLITYTDTYCDKLCTI